MAIEPSEEISQVHDGGTHTYPWNRMDISLK